MARDMRSSIDDQRRQLIAEIVAEARDAAKLTGRAELSDGVLAAMASVPRHEFVLEGDMPFAYINRPLPIGHGQTISQPLIVGLMTELLDLDKNDRVLEIGTGSGYQTAVLAEIAARVYSVEVIPKLADQARIRLEEQGYGNIEVRTGQGRKGWPGKSPFQAIIVTAASPDIPAPLIDQLALGGRMIIPIGSTGGLQNLVGVFKNESGRVTEKPILPVSFVPLV